MANRPPELSPAAWVVLGLVAEGPTHGFVLSQLLASDGELGQVWRVPRPLVYRELGKLVQLRLVAERGTVRTGRGPARTIVAITPAGRRALTRWLDEPVTHLREIRPSLLLKLALLQRAGTHPGPLVANQRRFLESQVADLEQARDGAVGVERLLGQWRLASSRANLQFLDDVFQDASPAPE